MAEHSSSIADNKRSKLKRRVVGLCRRIVDLDKRSQDHIVPSASDDDRTVPMTQTVSPGGDHPPDSQQPPENVQAPASCQVAVQTEALETGRAVKVHASVQTEAPDPDPHLVAGPEHQVSPSRSSLCQRIADLKVALLHRNAKIRRLQFHAKARERTITRLVGDGDPVEGRACELCGRDGPVPETEIVVRPWESEDAREWSRRTGDIYFFTGSDCDRERVGPSADQDEDESEDEIDEEDGWIWSELEWWKPNRTDESSDGGDESENPSMSYEEPAEVAWPQESYGETDEGDV